MARTIVFNVLETMCREELEDKLNYDSFESFREYKRDHNFIATLDYLKNSNNHHYEDLPDEVTFTGTYEELFEQIYSSGLIEQEYAFASKLKEEPEYGTLVQIRLKDVELLVE